MQEFAWCGYVLRSAIPLPELEVCDAPARSVLTWTCGPVDVPAAANRLIHRWVTDAGDTWVQMATCGAAYVLRFSLGITFVIEGTSIGWSVDSGAPSDTIRHLLLDQVLPLAMSTRGEYVLHAAAVVVGGGAVVFAGPSGRGKSTLAASCVAYGARLLADDCVRVTPSVGGFVAHPSYPGLRLWADSAAGVDAAARRPVAHYTTKLRVSSQVMRSAAPLSRIYLLERGGASRAQVLRGDASSVIDLTRVVFRLDPRHRVQTASDFGTTSDLVCRGIVKRLIVPDSLEALEDVVRAIEADAARSEAAAGVA